jgi:hypothetical protein
MEIIHITIHTIVDHTNKFDPLHKIPTIRNTHLVHQIGMLKACTQYNIYFKQLYVRGCMYSGHSILRNAHLIVITSYNVPSRYVA